MNYTLETKRLHSSNYAMKLVISINGTIVKTLDAVVPSFDAALRTTEAIVHGQREYPICIESCKHCNA
jgi:hypothetical protein